MCVCVCMCAVHCVCLVAMHRSLPARWVRAPYVSSHIQRLSVCVCVCVCVTQECGGKLLDLDWRKGHSPLQGGDTQTTGCVACEDTLRALCQVCVCLGVIVYVCACMCVFVCVCVCVWRVKTH